MRFYFNRILIYRQVGSPRAGFYMRRNTSDSQMINYIIIGICIGIGMGFILKSAVDMYFVFETLPL